MMKTINATDQGYWLLTQGSAIFWENNQLPFGRAEQFGLSGRKAMAIGQWQNAPLYLVNEMADGREYVSLREQLGLPEAQFNLLSRGVELNNFLQTHAFCGKCGGRTQLAADEWAVECECCHFRSYPVICPSIIVAVRKGKSILLANHKRHIESRIYTTLAGFVEVGESFEQTVAREVFEETGIQVKNLRYMGSQPWAFPNSQMVGFLADYAGGEIRLQEAEIHDARWFDCDQPLPQLPPTGTIARRLIEATLDICKQDLEKHD